MEHLIAEVLAGVEGALWVLSWGPPIPLLDGDDPRPRVWGAVGLIVAAWLLHFGVIVVPTETLQTR